MGEAKKIPQFIAAICICIGSLGTGTVIGWTSNIDGRLEQGELNEVVPDLKWTGSIMCLGAMAIFIPIGILSEKIGRKYSTLALVIPFTLGWLMVTFAVHHGMLLAGRFFCGMAGGAFCMCGPTYTSEIAQVEIRGILGTFMQLFLTIGILWANVGGWQLSIKIFCITCTLIPIIFGLLFMFQPESPVWLIKKKKKDKAISAFSRLRGKDYDASGEIAKIEEQIAKDEALKGHFMETLKTKQGIKSSVICFMLMFYQQLSGINAVMFYLRNIFKAASSTNEPILPLGLCTTIVGIVQVIATVVAAFTIDKLGRKILLIVSAGIMALSTVLLGVYFLLSIEEMVSNDTLTSIGWIPLLALGLFIIGFSFGMGPIPWLASSELFPNAIMDHMSSVAGLFNWFLAFCVGIGYAPVSDAFKPYTTFFIFGAISASCIPFVLLFMPETKGKTNSQIQEELG